MLRVEEVHAGYGTGRVLFGASLEVRPGEVVALMGRNGMGKTTLIRAVMGLVRVREGTVSWEGRPIHGLPPFRIARLGIGLAPEGREVFPTLTVRENLLAVAANYARVPDPYTVDRVCAIFPRLGERLRHRAGALSGGEQQMLAIARALMINPRLLLLDEATEGLAPAVRKEIWRGLAVLRRRGLGILVVDKDLRSLLAASDRCVIMEKGRTVWRDETPFSRTTPEITRRYLGI